MPELPTTIVGLLAFTVVLIVSDWVKHRGRQQADDSKIDELSKQTSLLSQIRDNAFETNARNAKIWKRVKRMHKRVDALYQHQFPNKKP